MLLDFPKMFVFLISCFSFILLSFISALLSGNTLLKTPFLPSFLGKLSGFLNSRFPKYRFAPVSLKTPEFPRLLEDGAFASILGNATKANETSLLDLPDLALDCIMERLSPEALWNAVRACGSLGEKCSSDRLWVRHMERKWGGLIGGAATREWRRRLASARRRRLSRCRTQKGLFGHLQSIRPFSWSKLKMDDGPKRNLIPLGSIMDWYLSLETGKFSFPAQVYNRENGHAGFMLSCYDAELTYDSPTDTFIARYSGYGGRRIEENIEWNRIRVQATDTPAHVLHVSDCLADLKPGDHIEVQWRRSKEFPYGWWYGVVGHLESCDGNKCHCRCHDNDTVMLEFKQYARGSQWRQIAINKKDHREVGNEDDGFYGGIRKLYDEIEISKWRSLWPTQILD